MTSRIEVFAIVSAPLDSKYVSFCFIFQAVPFLNDVVSFPFSRVNLAWATCHIFPTTKKLLCQQSNLTGKTNRRTRAEVSETNKCMSVVSRFASLVPPKIQPAIRNILLSPPYISLWQTTPSHPIFSFAQRYSVIEKKGHCRMLFHGYEVNLHVVVM